MKKFLSASLLLALVAGVASAEIPVPYVGTPGPSQADNWDVFLADPVPVGSTDGLVSYTLYVVNVSGDSAFDPTTFAGIGVDGAAVSGQLHEEQFASPFPPYAVNQSPDLLSSGGSTVDTHWLVDPNASALVIAAALSEPINDGLSAEPGDFGGNTGYSADLKGGWGFAAGSEPELASLDVIQIVVPAGSAFEVSLQTAASGMAGDYGATIPEPATMALIGLGGLALIRRRK